MRVLIAGCGYVGCALAELLCDEGHAVAGLRRSVGALPDGVERVAADLGDPSSLSRALAGRAADWVVYAAAADGRDEAAYRRAYVEGLSHLLDVIEPPQRFVFTSSTAVYGQDHGEVVDETSPTEPTRFTGDIMLEAEEIVDFYRAPSVVVRFGGIYGPTRTRLIHSVMNDRAELPSGPQLTNRIHRDDCAGVIAHLLALERPDPVYLGVDDEPADMRDVLRWLARELGRNEPPVSTGPPPSPGKRCDNASLRRSGYTFRHPSFREGYGTLLAELRGDPPTSA